MKKAILAAALAAALTGCAGMNYAMQHYSNVPIKAFQTEAGNTYRIFDKPDEDRLMITASIGAALGGGLVKGATFGAIQSNSAEVLYRDAAEEYLTSTGRKCQIRDIALIVEPQYEVRYMCESMETLASERSDTLADN